MLSRNSLVYSLLLIFLFIPTFSLYAEPPKREGATYRDISRVMKMVFYHHYNKKIMSPEVAEKTMNNLVTKVLDFQRLYLLQSDVKEIMSLKQQVLDAYTKRRSTGEEWVFLSKVLILFNQRYKEVMEHSFDYLKNVKEIDPTIVILDDSKQRGFPETVDQSKRWIEAYIQYNLSYLVNKKKYSFEDACKKLLDERQRNFAKRYKKDHYDMTRYFLNAFNAAVDPHTNYYSPEDYKEFNEEMQLSFEGIGARLLRDDVSGVSMIVEVIKDGPAFRGGDLQKFDEILGVKEAEEAKFVDVVGMDLSEIVRLIKGPKNSKVALKVRRTEDEQVKVLEVVIERGKVKTQDEAATIYYETLKGADEKSLLIGVIHLPSFYRDFEGFNNGDKNARSCADDVEKLLKEANEKQVDGIIFDLQNNGGGSLTDAIRIVGLFINEGVVVVTKDNKGREAIRKDPNKGIVYDGPLVVVINKRSASASEIVSGALKDYNRALIVGGERSFGKGTVQEIYGLGKDQSEKSLGAIKITINQFFTAGGSSTQWKGVETHLDFPSYFNVSEVGEKEYDEALPFEQIKSYINDKLAGNKWFRITGDLVNQLKKKSVDRINNNQQFIKIKEGVVKSKKKADEDKFMRVSEFLNQKEEQEKDEYDLEGFTFNWFQLLTSNDRSEIYNKIKDLNLFPSKNFGVDEDSSDYLANCFKALCDMPNLNSVIPRDVKHGSSLETRKLIDDISAMVKVESFDQKELRKLNKKLLLAYYPSLKGPFQNSTFIKESLLVISDMISYQSKELAKNDKANVDE